MRLTDIAATPDTDGHRIDLTWTNPDPVAAPGVRVVRREGSHPETPGDGLIVAHAEGITSVSDEGLHGETVYYYTLFPFKGTEFFPDPHNRATAMALSSYGFAGRIYAMLPAIYRRYDAETLTPGQENGELRRFLDLPGSELDRLHSLIRSSLGAMDLDRVDGRLLPLLAGWIGWPTDYALPIRLQRNEIRSAPSVYQVIGAVPTLDATVARVTGWTSRTKEFVHNVARTNQPERLNLWSATRNTTGVWSSPELTSVNFAYDGRPAVVREADGSLLFIYHTHRSHGWDIWSKRFAGGTWQPSEPIIGRPGADKHPSAALAGTKLWLFWQSDRSGDWRINVATRTGGTWSQPELFGDVPRRMPAAVADHTGGLWLFWVELSGGRWVLRYNRHDGTQWGAAQTMPADEGQEPRVEDDLFAVFHPSSASQRLWLFWARHEPGQAKWGLVYRIKEGLDPAAADWSPIRQVPKTGTHHDRQPAALLSTGGDVELFWSSTRGGGWSVVRNTLAIGPLTWGTPQQVTTRPYSERAPLPVDLGGNRTLLLYRSNESIAYDSAAYGATHTLDHRYAGTTTVDVGATAKLALRGTFGDFQTYTYDAGRTNDDHIARDTVGLFLPPEAATNQDAVARLAGVLTGFMPATTRAVFIPE